MPQSTRKYKRSAEGSTFITIHLKTHVVTRLNWYADRTGRKRNDLIKEGIHLLLEQMEVPQADELEVTDEKSV